MKLLDLKHARAGLVLFWAVLGFGSAAGVQAGELTLLQALRQADIDNPTLQAARWNAGIRDGERQQADLLPNPTLSWSTEDTGENAEETIQVSQPVLLGGKREARVAVATRKQQVTRLVIDQQRQGIWADVIQAFMSARLAQERLEIAGQARQLADRAARAADVRVRAGKSSPVEASRGEVQLLEVELEVNRARRELAIAGRRLATLLGHSAQAPSVGGPLRAFPALPDLDVLLGQLDQTVGMQLALRQIDQQEAALGLEQANRLPDLNVSVGSQRKGEDSRSVIVLGVSMPLPLFDRNQGNVHAAAQRVGQAKDLRNATELKLRGESREVILQWQTALQTVDALEERIIPAASLAVDRATRGFEMGKFDFLQVLDASRTLLAVRREYLQGLSEIIDAWARLVRIYGQDLLLSPLG